MCAILTILLILSPNFVHCYQQWTTIYDKITQEEEFSGYKTMIRNDKASSLNLLYSGVTVFVPTNDAIRTYTGFFRDAVVLYHMGTQPYTLKQLRLNNTVQSAHGDNPPLWVSVTPDGYYINNAKILEKRSNYMAKCKRNENLNQVLHVIDRVLDPMTPMANPSAFDFLQHYDQWDLGPFKIFNFWTRVQYHDKSEWYQKPGGHTFFIPIDDKMDDYRLQSIDSYVIDGHVVPNMVLFTRPTTKNFIFESASNGDYIYIVLSMTSRNDRFYVKSFTVLGDSDHKRGEVFAEIIKSDIPVTNGVVHLISKPLAVFDRQLQFFPYLPVIHKVTMDPNLDFTYNLAKNRINKILKRERGMYTYFAPKNQAWGNYTGYSRSQLVDILARHLIVSEVRYTIPKLVALAKSGNGTTFLETLGGTLRLQIDHFDGYYHLKWGTKWVRVSRPDYRCSDGVVHVVDDVFATPKFAKPPQTPKSGFWRTLKDAFT
ncbi:fasciclin-1 [Tribolium castaneum]|uniref:Fasciclin-1-like Protein n=1 Tax=Tribolium castaneum TaxID=7070 RepID=D2A3S4_TRICA|nr:PREDICTED: fasciclin-1 [Tribolium castaneum]EFA05558.1 Fasciclin-1-like Protein [Tribolium castaneum]|eukprot:XP_008194921.1 PREDICTED: fasciclin-1 [Tribolium castaneum]